MRIMYVDDQEDLLEIYEDETKIELENWEVSLAVNGIDALEKIKENRPNILVTDIKMPKMGGLELAKELLQKNEPITIIAITGYPGDVSQDEMRACGISKIFEKPVDFDELFAFIKTLP